MLFSRFLILLGSSVVAANPTPPSNKHSTERHGDVVYIVYHRATTRSKLSFVKDSGIGETTPVVNQYSGYFSIGEDADMWFWFFESRNNPRTAPLVSWFGGGPGISAQYGMFTQHGPCKILEDGAEPTLREHSLNNHANVLYIDQLIGSGFSYGDGAKVNSTKQSSHCVWTFLQLWFEAFTEYGNRELSVFTELHGGHTGTDIVNYILDKDLEIKARKTNDDVITVKALSASNAWFNARIQKKANLDFALNNTYRPLINESLYEELMEKYKTEVVPSLKKCDESSE